MILFILELYIFLNTLGRYRYENNILSDIPDSGIMCILNGFPFMSNKNAAITCRFLQTSGIISDDPYVKNERSLFQCNIFGVRDVFTRSWTGGLILPERRHRLYAIVC